MIDGRWSVIPGNPNKKLMSKRGKSNWYWSFLAKTKDRLAGSGEIETLFPRNMDAQSRRKCANAFVHDQHNAIAHTWTTTI
jgi:hypothetical protein